MTEQAKAPQAEHEVWDEIAGILGADRESWDARVDDLGEATLDEIQRVMANFKLRDDVPAEEALRLAWLLIHYGALWVWAPGHGEGDELKRARKAATLSAVLELSRLLGRG